ncbi:MAG: beta-ketoacyl synthase N-terminal-like domain-containing protein, partial [Candidatus Sumerlaeota bacterium]
MNNPVYLTDSAAFLPGHPIDNHTMEDLLGRVYDMPSRTRRIILRNNGIKTRHYAIDPESGEQSHTNAQMAAGAIKKLNTGDFDPSSIDTLACGTASADQIMPGHASQVHGWVGGGPMEILSASGICVSAVAALKYAAMAVASGESKAAVAVGSELASSFLRGAFHENRRPADKSDDLEQEPALAFDADFLRWMLSDGAGAFLLKPEKDQTSQNPNLKIEWIQVASYAHELEPCMFAGAVKRDNGTLKGWREFGSIAEAAAADAFAIKQDVKLLNAEIMPVSGGRGLESIAGRRGLQPGDVDWFLPHYSSEYFRPRLDEAMRSVGFGISQEKWYTNLSTRGNT